MQPSMNSVGTWHDNAPMESLIGTIKSEWIYHSEYPARAQARTGFFYYIETFYNRPRRHSSLDYLVPRSMTNDTIKTSTLP